MAHMNHGGGFVTGGAVRRSPMHVYDSLPPRIRKLVADAPYDYATESIAGKITEIGVELTEKRMREIIASEIQRNAVAAYGPDHPQAG